MSLKKLSHGHLATINALIRITGNRGANYVKNEGWDLEDSEILHYGKGDPNNQKKINKQNEILTKVSQLLPYDTYLKDYYKVEGQALRDALEEWGDLDNYSSIVIRPEHLLGMGACAIGVAEAINKIGVDSSHFTLNPRIYERILRGDYEENMVEHAYWLFRMTKIPGKFRCVIYEEISGEKVVTIRYLEHGHLHRDPTHGGGVETYTVSEEGEKLETHRIAYYWKGKEVSTLLTCLQGTNIREMNTERFDKHKIAKLEDLYDYLNLYVDNHLVMKFFQEVSYEIWKKEEKIEQLEWQLEALKKESEDAES